MSQQQQPNQDGNSFLGARNIIAIALAIGILIGWQYYMGKKYGNTTAQRAQEKAATTNPAAGENSPSVPVAGETPGAGTASIEAQKAGAPATAVTSSEVSEKVVTFEDDNLKIEIINRGMAFKTVTLKKYHDRKDQLVVLGRTVAPYLFQTNALGDFENQSLNFEVERKSETEFVGTAMVGNVKVVKSMTIKPNQYTVDLKVDLVGNDPRVRGLRTYLVEDTIPTEGASFLNPALDFQTVFVSHNDGQESKQLDKKQFETAMNIPAVQAAAVGQHYFASGIVDISNRVVPQFFGRLDESGKTFIGHWDYVRNSGDQSLDLSMKLYAGPKSVDLLKTVDERLVGIVDYGWFGWLARPMLWLMNVLFSFMGNYGLAIIFLTLIVRLMVLPLHMSSYKSMKAMAAINPQMQAIREKYKADPQRMNMEIMALMKTNKVNPVGGCLPMLLQLPVFFALYRVLGNSIELYQAPFILWIHDLSLKDPFYVLPVLMGIVMFIQQKITPSTMDPAQQKVFMIMPVVFAGMMISLPSGLTLYIFVSTLFGILQQIYFMDKKAPAKAAVPVRAGK